MNVKFLKTTLAVVCVVAVGTGSWRAYSEFNTELTESELLLAENIEALSLDGEDNGTYPRYINESWRRAYNETKIETKKDSTGRSYDITFKRNCSAVITYCEYTGREKDICYGTLNGVKTDCNEWIEN